MRGARLLAQAKLNLFLRVLGRDVSGYHALETLFQRIGLGDDVAVRVDVAGRSLDCRGADVGPTERNLAWRAAVAYAGAAGWPRGFAVEVDKRIPAGGGLGGGSADAGAVLRLLDHLSPRPLGQAALLQLAVALGADVPFLTTSAPRALAWGRGERLLTLPPLPSLPVVLLLPPVAVPTADAFRWLATDRHADNLAGPGAAGSVPSAMAMTTEQLSTWDGMAGLAVNDLERPVTERLPAVAALAALRRRSEGPDAFRDTTSIFAMTGSGSTWFAAGADAAGRAERWAAAGRLPVGTRLVCTSTAVEVVAPEEMD